MGFGFDGNQGSAANASRCKQMPANASKCQQMPRAVRPVTQMPCTAALQHYSIVQHCSTAAMQHCSNAALQQCAARCKAGRRAPGGAAVPPPSERRSTAQQRAHPDPGRPAAPQPAPATGRRSGRRAAAAGGQQAQAAEPSDISGTRGAAHVQPARKRTKCKGKGGPPLIGCRPRARRHSASALIV